jgi:hypothetical protein
MMDGGRCRRRAPGRERADLSAEGPIVGAKTRERQRGSGVPEIRSKALGPEEKTIPTRAATMRRPAALPQENALQRNSLTGGIVLAVARALRLATLSAR